MTAFELAQRQMARSQLCFQAGVLIRDRLGGSIGPIEERLEHVRIAALSSVAEARAVMHALKLKGILTDAEEQDCLDFGYRNLLDQITAGLGAKIFEEGGHG